MTILEPRLTKRDCLYVLYQSLLRQGGRVPIYDADRRERWIKSCTELLAHVPNICQRAVWTVLLAEELAQGECSVRAVSMEIWRRVEAA